MKQRTTKEVLAEYQEKKMSFKDLMDRIGRRHVATIQKAHEALELGGAK